MCVLVSACRFKVCTARYSELGSPGFIKYFVMGNLNFRKNKECTYPYAYNYAL